MRVNVCFITPDRDEPGHGLEFDMPSVPDPGDVIAIQRPGQEGTGVFMVRRRTWHLDYPLSGAAPPADGSVVGITNSATIECEFAVGSFVAEEHKLVAGK